MWSATSKTIPLPPPPHKINPCPLFSVSLLALNGNFLKTYYLLFAHYCSMPAISTCCSSYSFFFVSVCNLPISASSVYFRTCGINWCFSVLYKLLKYIPHFIKNIFINLREQFWSFEFKTFSKIIKQIFISNY